MDRQKKNVCITGILCILLASGLFCIISEEDSGRNTTETASQTEQAPVPSVPSGGDGSVPAARDAQDALDALDDDPIRDLRNLVERRQTGISEAALTEAARILDFTNRVATYRSWFDQADTIAFFIRIYLGEWRLAILPSPSDSRSTTIRTLRPPRDLFSEEVRESLTRSLEKMSDALDSMLADYRSLDEYVKDDSTTDEGAKGKRLARTIQRTYARFTEARKQYFSIIRTEGTAAEDLFLADAPLRRQILAARALFDQFQDVADALAEEKVDRTRTRMLEKRIRAISDYAGMPPFQETPGRERVYRAFLKEIRTYEDVLKKGNEEGFSTETRTTLNLLLSDCRTAYNSFVESCR